MLRTAIALGCWLSGFAAPLAWAEYKPPAGIAIDKAKKAVIIDARVAPRKLPHLESVYPIEVIACWGYVKDAKPGDKNGKKAHETVLTTDVLPSDVAKAMIEVFGLKPGKPAVGENATSEGPEVNLTIEVPQSGAPKRLTLDKILVDPKTNAPMPKGVKFRFTGSLMVKVAADKEETMYGADRSGTLIMLFPVDGETVFQSTLTMKEEKFLKLEVKKDVLPKEGDPVKLVIEVVGK